MNPSTVKTCLTWVVAVALFMEGLDTTIVNTAVPAIAEGLQVTPLSLKAVVTSYILSLAVCIPVSGWMADRYGTRRVFGIAVAVFTFASILCGLAQNAPMLVAGRILQGVGAAMMMLVGRLAMMIGVVVCLFSLVTPGTPVSMIVLLGLAMGFFNSLQYTSMNSMAFADIDTPDSSMASTISSSMQQMSIASGWPAVR